MAVLLFGFLLLFFWKALGSDCAIFSNEAPLGQVRAEWGQQPSGRFACWDDLSWLGAATPGGLFPIAAVLFKAVVYLIYLKTYAPFAIMFVGLSAWFCFQQWKFARWVCMVGGLGVALNSDFFSTACWGVASQPIAFGLDFLALGALADETGPRRWVRVVLAGMAVGMGVTEAGDIGALFSLYVAAFVAFQALSREGRLGARVASGLGRLTVVTVSALVLAAGSLGDFYATQVKGIVGMGQDAASKARRWNEATLWSLPKTEALGLAVPGLFGFRMDTPKDMVALKGWFAGGEYWGAVGQDPAYDQYFEAKKAGKEAPPPDPLLQERFTGGGFYAGVLILVVAAWGILQSFLRTKGVFSPRECRFIWFWLGAAMVSMLLAYGRFAPFYQLFYALPGASIMRSPAKFIHLVTWALLVLFGYGLQGLSRLCLERPEEPPWNLRSHWMAWWAKAAAWDRGWVKGSGLALAGSLLAWVMYAGNHQRVVAYLQEVGFDPAKGNVLANFSLRQAGWFILFLVLALGLVAVVLSGYFNGRRSRLGIALIGAVLALDLMPANLPWVIIYNWKQAYESSPVLDLLREKPFEQRVSVLQAELFFQLDKFPAEARPLLDNYFTMEQLYATEWKQHLFQYYNIQSLDFDPRMHRSAECLAFEGALAPTPLRHWELTNTRYLFGLAIPADKLNSALDPIRKRFRILKYFRVALKADTSGPLTGYDQLTADPTTDGPCALYEFAGGLPRARLYTHWQTSTNDQETLKQLASPGFDPAQQVLLAAPLPAPAAAGANQPAGTVEFTSYAPKKIELRAKAPAPSVLLLNDQFHPGWNVTVDGKPAQLLRCNYLMRGVQVPAGDHQVEFRFTAPITAFCISLAGLALGVALLGFLAIAKSSDHSIG